MSVELPLKCASAGRVLHPLAILIASATLLAPVSRAQLQWGPGGAGGSGTWNATNPNWWDGSSNVAWNGGVALFGGAAGTVTSEFSGQTAAGIIFNVPGYQLQDGTINGSPSGLTITTNADATIGSRLGGNFSNAMVKNGLGVLTVTGTNTFRSVTVAEGEYRAVGGSDFSFADVVLADASGVTVTLGGNRGSKSFGSLSGGGAAGGVVQAEDAANTEGVSVSRSGTFDGRLQDNGSGKLSFEVWGLTSAVQTLTAANTHSGVTIARSGTLALSGNGSVLNSKVYALNSGTVRLDNSTTALPNRLSDSLAVTLQSGTLALIGHDTVALEESAGNLSFTGATKIILTQPGAAPAQLTFAGSSRITRGTLDVSGPGLKWNGLSNGSGAIVAAHITAGAEWATVGDDGRIAPLAIYANDINSAGAVEDVKLSGAGTFTLANTATRNSVNLQNSAGSTGTLVLGGNTLTLASGGLLTGGSSGSAITAGILRPSGSELVITNRNTLSINAVLAESTASTGLTKSGIGALVLNGQNTFTGDTVLNEGTLIVGSDAALGLGSALTFNGGKLQASASFTSNKTLNRVTDRGGVRDTIDTAGFDVAFSGQNFASVSKQGSGTLTLTHPSTGFTAVRDGTLALPNATFGFVSLLGGTLEAKGALPRMHLDASSRLDIGGPAAATLITGTYETFGPAYKLTIDFGIGASGSDLWTINATGFGNFRNTGSTLFDFDDLGGLMTGTDYSLIKLPARSGASNAAFALSPNLASAGWEAAFRVEADTVKVRFSQVPEPATASLIVASVSWIALRQRRSRFDQQPA